MTDFGHMNDLAQQNTHNKSIHAHDLLYDHCRGRAIVLGNVQCPGLLICRRKAYCACRRCDWGFDIDLSVGGCSIKTEILPQTAVKPQPSNPGSCSMPDLREKEHR